MTHFNPLSWRELIFIVNLGNEHRLKERQMSERIKPDLSTRAAAENMIDGNLTRAAVDQKNKEKRPGQHLVFK